MFKNIILSLGVGVILGFIIFHFGFKTEPEVITQVRLDTVWKTDTLIKKEYFPKYTTIIKTDTIREVDTVKVIEQYFAKFAYIDTLINNDTLFIVLNDTVSQNQIKRAYSMNLNIPTIEKTITEKHYPNSLYIIGGLGVGEFKLQAQYNFKKKHSVGLSIDNNTNILIHYGVRVY